MNPVRIYTGHLNVSPQSKNCIYIHIQILLSWTERGEIHFMSVISPGYSANFKSNQTVFGLTCIRLRKLKRSFKMNVFG